MLSRSWKSHVSGWARFVPVFALGTLLALLACAFAEAQAPQPAQAAPAAVGPPPGASTPAAVAPTAPPAPAAKAAPAKSAPAKTDAPPPAKPATPAKPPAPLLNRDYKGIDKLPEGEEKAYQAKRSRIQQILGADTLSPADEQFLVDYYRRYALARWTYPDQQHEVATRRRELKSELAKAYKPNRSNPAHDKLTEVVLQYMRTLSDPKTLADPKYNFAPTARVSAVLMLGELNEVEPSGSRAAKPLAAALPDLLQRATDPRQIDAVRLAALIGIRRHCRLMDPSAPVPNSIAKPLVDLIRAKEPERVRTEEGHAWLRLQAVQMFADLQGRPRPVDVAKLLLTVLAETDSPEFLRYAAAEALGSLDYRNPAGLDMNSMLQALGLLAIEVCDQERQRLRDELESKKMPNAGGFSGSGGDMAGMPMMGSEGMGSGMEMGMSAEGSEMYGSGGMGPRPTTTKEDRQIERARRRLKDGMTAALVGMGKKRKTLARDEKPSGISAMAGTDPLKTQNIDAFSNAIHAFFVKIDTKENDKQIDLRALDTAIAEVRKELETAMTQAGGTAPPSPEFDPLPVSRPGEMFGSGSMMSY